MYRYTIVLIIYTLSLLSLEIEFKEITSRQIFIEKEHKKQDYQLTAKKYIENFSKKNKVKFFINRKLYMLKNNYYSEGVFQSQKTKLFYKKAYVLFGKVYLFDVNGTIDKAKVTAKEVIFDGYQNYLLKKCEIIENKSIYRRNKFKLTIL
ncbi:MAG: hypothetical protein KAU90_00580 [Sulfurovaceae bacterium]|nr:hypothetical protein [Sulfurovaceae bacterium]